MTRNEIMGMANQPLDKFDLAVEATKVERQRIVEHIRRSARHVDAGVSKPDLWALAQYIEKTLL
jgi:hypothetical protein